MRPADSAVTQQPGHLSGKRRPRRQAHWAILGGVLVALAPAPAAHAAPVTFSFTGSPVAIPDGLDLTGMQPGPAATAPVVVSGLTPAIADVDFRLDGPACNATQGSTTVGIDHPFANDLEIKLTSPEGTTALLIDNTGIDGNNFCQTRLDDDIGGAASIESAQGDQAPFTGTWKPANALSAFDGEDPNGTWTVSAQDYVAADTGNLRAVSVIVTSKATPTIAATSSADVDLGGAVSDSAVISGRDSPAAGDTVDFRLYGPGDLTCTGTAVFESLGRAVGSGGAASSASFTPTASGTYRWIASYSGDANNVEGATDCVESEQSAIVRARPTIAGTSSADVDLGGAVTDTAIVSGRPGAGADARRAPAVDDTLSFALFGPDDATCTDTPVFESLDRPIDADGEASSKGFTPVLVGTYRWVVSYSGDAYNATASNGCAASGQAVVVRKPAVITPPPAFVEPPPAGAKPPAPRPKVVRPPATRKACMSRRRFDVRLIRRAGILYDLEGARIRSVTVRVGRGPARRQKFTRTVAKVDVRGMPKGSYAVRIVIRLRSGRIVTYAPTYRTCKVRRPS